MPKLRSNGQQRITCVADGLAVIAAVQGLGAIAERAMRHGISGVGTRRGPIASASGHCQCTIATFGLADERVATLARRRARRSRRQQPLPCRLAIRTALSIAAVRGDSRFFCEITWIGRTLRRGQHPAPTSVGRLHGAYIAAFLAVYQHVTGISIAVPRRVPRRPRWAMHLIVSAVRVVVAAACVGRRA